MAVTMKKHLLALVLCLSAGVPALCAASRQDTLSVAMPWNRSVMRANATGSSTSVHTGDLDKVPAVDMRNMFTGLWPSLDVTELSGDFRNYLGNATGLSLDSGNFSITNRHLSNIICIVDDVPVPFGNLMLEPSQIESITLLNDVADKAKYGPLASSGALLIRTRSGRYDSPSRIQANIEGGIGIIDRMPEWVNGYEYASLNNLARLNAGYSPRFSNVDAYRQLRPTDHVYPNVDYRDLMVDNFKNIYKADITMSGGNHNIHYFAGLGAAHEDGLVKIGPAVNYNKINFISRVNAKVGRYLETSVGVVGNIALSDNNASSMTAFKDVPAIAFPAILGYFTPDSGSDVEVAEGTPVYALSRTTSTNPYATLMEGGFSNARHRSGMFNASVDWDLGWLLKGLKSRTFVDINLLNAITVGKKNDYLAYYWDAVEGIGELTSHRGEKVTSKSLQSRAAFQEWLAYENLSYTAHWGGHRLLADATYYISDCRNTQNSYYERQQNAIGSLSWSFRDRYNMEAVAQYAGNARLPESNRYAFFPAAGASWTLSNEPFMKEVAWVDFLKLRAQAGINGTSDIFSEPYLYESDYSYVTGGMTFGPYTYGRWFGNNTAASRSTTITRVYNPALGWERRKEADLGAEARLFNGLELTFNYFWHTRDGIIADVEAKEPAMSGLGGMMVYDNGISIKYQGWEAVLGYKGRAGRLRYAASLSASHYRSSYLRLDTDFFSYNYQSQIGRSTTGIWGYYCAGRFTSEEEIASSPLYSASTFVGDLKYVNQNDDNVINSNDARFIGDSEPKLRYAVSIDLGYGPFRLRVTGTGKARYDLPLTNGYFWNGWGDGNYSAFVRDNLGGDYPRLSYVKSQGNFLVSDFWLRDGSFFKIQSAEFSYTAPTSWGKRLGASSIVFFARGANLLTLTKIPYIDPESPAAGVSSVPLYRTLSCGAKFLFQ